MKTQNGFTLIELMVVVAIIGILAAVGIPMYQRYQGQARQSEAKLSLSSVFTALTSFSVENGSFSACINRIGLTLPTSSRFYTIGFRDGSSATCGPNAAAPVSCLRFNFNQAIDCANNEAAVNATAGVNTVPTVQGDIPNDPLFSRITRTEFAASAVGRISQNTALGTDQWTINQNKELLNRRRGF